jgi:hypothetical protein
MLTNIGLIVLHSPWYIFIGVSMCNPREGLCRGWQSDHLEARSDRSGRRRHENPKTMDAPPGWHP